MARPPKYKTPEDMQKIIDLYFLTCKVHRLQAQDIGNPEELLTGLSDEELLIVNDIDDVRPTVSGLALALDISTESLRNYEVKEEFLGTIKRAKQRIENALENNLYGQAVTGTIFNLKNNFGWKDVSQKELSGPQGGAIEIAERPQLSKEEWLELHGIK